MNKCLLERRTRSINTIIDLTYDITQLLENTSDAGKASGTLTLQIDVRSDLWDLIVHDPKISEATINLLAINDKAWENFIYKNFSKLIHNNMDKLREIYVEDALKQLYANWQLYKNNTQNLFIDTN